MNIDFFLLLLLYWNFFCVLCFSFGSRHTSCKTYDTDSRCGICESSWLGTFNWLRINNGGVRPGSFEEELLLLKVLLHILESAVVD